LNVGVNVVTDEYLINIPQREFEAIQRFLKPPLTFISNELWRSLGFVPSFSWYLLQIRTDRLVGKDCLINASPGDVDIIAGQLHPNDSGGINWPPSTNYLAGIEVKCAYLSSQAHQITNNDVKSQKKSKQKQSHIHSQLKGLLQMGFNKAILLDVIANPPASGTNGQAWLNAASIAATSREAMLSTLEGRLPRDCPVGHWVWSMGSVIGGAENARGAGAPFELRNSLENPYLKDRLETQSCRQEMERNLKAILASVSRPCEFPIVLIDCRSCAKIHKAENECTDT